MTIRNLSFMMQPGSVALIAADRGPSPIGDVVAQNLLSAGFRGEIFAVDYGGGALAGVPVYADIEDLPKAPELAIVSAAPDMMPDLITRLGALGTKAVAIISTRQGERDIARGPVLQSAMLEAARLHRIRILGPGSLGIMTPGISLNASFARVQPIEGSLAFVAQSGSVLTTVLDWATSRDIGFSHLVSLGDMIDIDFGDMLDYFANDPGSQAILLYIEAVREVRKFMSAARLAARLKPVIVLKGGRYEYGACSSPVHTGGIPAGSDAVYDAAFRRAGMLRVYDIRELFSAAESLARDKTVPGARLAILTNGGGMGVLAADALIDEGGRLAELSADSTARLSALLPGACSHGNPIDLQGDAAGGRYAEALEILLGDRCIDAVLVLHCPNAVVSGVEIGVALVEAMKKCSVRLKSHRLLTCWLGDETAAEARRLFRENRISTYETPFDAVSGFMQMVRFRRSQEVLMQTPPSIPKDFCPDLRRAQRMIDEALAAGRVWLTESEVTSVLDAYCIPARAKVGGKGLHELVIAVFNDAQFGPMILFGHGGSAMEVIQDNALALPPLNMHLARELMTRTRIYRLIEGGHGMPAADTDGIALVLVKVSQLICDIPQIVELKINPLLADDHGLFAAEASIRVTEAVGPATERLAIRPYPKELEQVITLPDGHTLLLRPIRPEDEPAYLRLFDSLSPEDIFMRFMSCLRTLPHSLAARLSQIDYDREMALVLIDQGGSGETELLGGVRFSADADNERAEFAILLRRDMTGMGLGPMMMRRIIECACRRGIRELYGEVLCENQSMLKLCRALGFSLKRMPEDPGLVIASLAL